MNKSTFAIIISIIAIFIAGVAASSLEFDFQNSSFTIGALTLLVTLLVGWQIYNTIGIEEKIHNEVEKEADKASKIAMLVTFAQLGRTADNKKNIANAISSLFNALAIWEKEMDSPLAKEAYNYCIDKLTEISKQDVIFEVESAEEKDIYIKAALKTEVRPLIDFTTNRIVVKSKGVKKDS
ncbi:MAG: hypothetical protein J5735_04395 [Prevotella sp.]|nr:hypothetical protein [Prevotella sp.]